MTRDEIIEFMRKLLNTYSKPEHFVERLMQVGVLKVDDAKSDEPLKEAMEMAQDIVNKSGQGLCTNEPKKPREFWIAFYKDGSTEVFYEQPSEFRTFPEDLKGISHVREVVTESEPKQPKEPSASQSRVVLDTERIKKEQFDAKLHALSEYLSKIKERESNIDELIKLGIEYFQAKVK